VQHNAFPTDNVGIVKRDIAFTVLLAAVASGTELWPYRIVAVSNFSLSFQPRL
jgi:3-deoxy-D-manno-octulosonic-acid transferase